jgi:uncharacterized flavoprotein (TIGR03862 family)
MAAETLARAGVHVTVIDQMPSVGRKFVLAGRSGLNLTHSEPTESMLRRYCIESPSRTSLLDSSDAEYGQPASALAPLFGAIEQFDAATLRSWADRLGYATYVGSSGRVFPECERATPILRSWLAELQKLGVDIRTRCRWIGFVSERDSVASPIVAYIDGSGTRVHLTSDVTVLALGGASWPRTGSDGQWQSVLSARALTVRPLTAANSGLTVAWSRRGIDTAAGLPLKNIVVSHGGLSVRGEAVFTATGLEGGAVYAIGATVRATLADAPTAMLAIDLHPDVSVDALAARLNAGRSGETMARRLARVKVGAGSVAVLREVTGNNLPGDALALAALIKATPVPVTGTSPIARAISSAGGLSMGDLDHRFMIKSIPGVFACGEMLDWDAPTGGYLLQGCFSSGHRAAHGALEFLDRGPITGTADDKPASLGQIGSI